MEEAYFSDVPGTRYQICSKASLFCTRDPKQSCLLAPWSLAALVANFVYSGLWLVYASLLEPPDTNIHLPLTLPKTWSVSHGTLNQQYKSNGSNSGSGRSIEWWRANMGLQRDPCKNPNPGEIKRELVMLVDAFKPLQLSAVYSQWKELYWQSSLNVESP